MAEQKAETELNKNLDELAQLFEQSEKEILQMIAGRSLRVDQVAQKLQVSTRQVYRWISDGQLIAFKLRSRLRIPEASIVSFVTRRLLQQAREILWHKLTVVFWIFPEFRYSIFASGFSSIISDASFFVDFVNDIVNGAGGFGNLRPLQTGVKWRLIN